MQKCVVWIIFQRDVWKVDNRENDAEGYAELRSKYLGKLENQSDCGMASVENSMAATWLYNKLPCCWFLNILRMYKPPAAWKVYEDDALKYVLSDSCFDTGFTTS